MCNPEQMKACSHGKKRAGIGDHFNGLASMMLELREPMFSGWWCNYHLEKF